MGELRIGGILNFIASVLMPILFIVALFYGLWESLVKMKQGYGQPGTPNCTTNQGVLVPLPAVIVIWGGIAGLVQFLSAFFRYVWRYESITYALIATLQTATTLMTMWLFQAGCVQQGDAGFVLALLLLFLWQWAAQLFALFNCYYCWAGQYVDMGAPILVQLLYFVITHFMTTAIFGVVLTYIDSKILGGWLPLVLQSIFFTITTSIALIYLQIYMYTRYYGWRAWAFPIFFSFSTLILSWFLKQP